LADSTLSSNHTCSQRSSRANCQLFLHRGNEADVFAGKNPGNDRVAVSSNNYRSRDVNAALNILGEGLKLMSQCGGRVSRHKAPGVAAVGIPEALNACEELVRPGVIQAEIVEAGITRLQVV